MSAYDFAEKSLNDATTAASVTVIILIINLISLGEYILHLFNIDVVQL